MYLASKKTWTRRMVLVTDGRSPIELDEWESTPRTINERNVNFTIVYDLPFCLSFRCD
jgi:ATP-dependent DNA helicase 2 subunit 2